MRINSTTSGSSFRASTLTEKSVGHIAQTIGSILDVAFPQGKMPNIYNSLVVKGNNRVKTVAMNATNGLMRGMEVIDTRAPLKPVDNLGLVDTRTTSPIHRSTLAFIQLDTKLLILKHALKNIAESKVALVHGQMNEPSGPRMRVAGSKISASLGRMPSAVGYQPILNSSLQERITFTKEGSITSIQAIYVPADDLTDPAPATTFAHLDATNILSRGLAAKGIYPIVDPLNQTLQHYKELQNIIAILGPDELSEEDHLTVASAQKIAPSPGKYVGLSETIRGFQLILSLELDGLPEQAFYLVGNIDDAIVKAINLEVESKLKK
ncbi:hypothetical protein AMTRI_Chr08g204210 [Amborella trichopoda]